ncbi:MAG: purine-nucleoside phosphorylase [Bacteroidales bacterium]|nr:purine-nucleoside phosphorylase [Bacteroidales bacterium]
MVKKIRTTTEWLEKKISVKPEIGLVLGSGLGEFAEEIAISFEIPYEEIPNFPKATVSGHDGKLIFGTIAGKHVVAMKGRFHYYEGYSQQEITFPIRVMKFLGVELLLLSNASGGMNPNYIVGDIMIITDHINLMGTNPLIGPNIDGLGPRFPDMGAVYDRKLVDLAKATAREIQLDIKFGVYAAVTGPVYETPAEYRYMYRIGADAVGMSTVPEAIVAHHMGMKLFAVSVISDLGIEGQIETITHEQVVEAAKATEPKLATLLLKMFEKL